MVGRLFKRICEVFVPNQSGPFAGECQHSASGEREREPSHSQAHAAQHDGRATRSRSPGRQSGAVRNAPQLLKQGRMRIGCYGFCEDGFEIVGLGRHDSELLVSAVDSLGQRVRDSDHRNIAGGLRLALHALETPEPGRAGILLITSGGPTLGSEEIPALAETAVSRRVGIHVICLGQTTGGVADNALKIHTKEALGYGSLREVASDAELLVAVQGFFDGLAPARTMRGINRAIVLLDCCRSMGAAHSAGASVENVRVALQEYLRRPLVRSYDP